jgi:bifunctional DNase/RNase
MAEVECELSRVVMSETRATQVIVLKERGGERQIPISIGLFEVHAIHRTVNREPPVRPMTHELFGNVLDALGVEIERVLIHDLREIDGVPWKTYFGRLVLRRDGETFNVDSRPSDAIALAVQKDAPIFVEESVLDEGGRP